MSSVRDEIRAQYPDSYHCPTHGDYPTKEQDWRIATNCPQCDRALHEAEEKLQRAWRLRRRWENTGLPLRYRNRTFANWSPQSTSQSKVLAAVQTYAKALRAAYDDGRGLVLAGDVGTGKTHLAAALLHDIVKTGFDVEFVSVGDLFAAIKRGFGKGKAEFDIGSLQDADFLILDDLGASRGTEWEVSVLHELLRYRYDKTLPTIVTTNVTKLEDAVGIRIADRFAENMVRISIAGTSRRSERLSGYGADGFPQPPREVTVRVCVAGEMTDRTARAGELQPLPSRNRS